MSRKQNNLIENACQARLNMVNRGKKNSFLKSLCSQDMKCSCLQQGAVSSVSCFPANTPPLASI